MTYKTYTKAPNKRKTPQREPIPGEVQLLNNAGGYVYGLDPWLQLERFLILGTTGGTYYVTEQKLTKDNAAVIQTLIALDGTRVVDTVVAISDAGRAPSNDPALFVLALASGATDVATRQYALAALPKVARTPTHLFHFLEFVKGVRGWGGGLRRAVEAWVNRWEAGQLAFEFAKYQSRDGWSTLDVLRKAHVKARTPEHDAILRWATVGPEGLGHRRVLRKLPGTEARVDQYTAVSALPGVIAAMESVKRADVHESTVINAITDFGLTREMIPTQFLKSPAVWEVLLATMKPEAMIRNLGNMTKVGLLTSTSAATKHVVATLTDSEKLRKARIHPLKVITALKFYEKGGAAGKRAQAGGDTYAPVRQVVDALDEAFYASFGFVEPTGKRLILALDVSGSMDAPLHNSPLSCREGTAVLAMVTARVESDYTILGFCASAKKGYQYYGGGHGVTELSISPRQRLDDIVEKISGLPFGGTDCALPALWAAKQKDAYDGIAIYTDCETWAGSVHPSQALRTYREQVQRPVRQVVIGMVSTGFTIADPNDPLSLDCVGFDTNTPEAMSQFVRG
jgi:60 kDa SS-A/Ro ribonucleoprotein